MATLKEKFGKFELGKEQVKSVKGGDGVRMIGATCEDGQLYFAGSYVALQQLLASTSNKKCELVS
jgi:hypothetical protein